MNIVQLEVGDVVEMKEGMAVEYDHFEHIFFSAGKIDGVSSTIVYIGKVYNGRGDQWATRLRVRNAIKEVFEKEGLPVEEDILRRFLAHQIKDKEQPKQLLIPPGLYQVTKVDTVGLARIIHCKTHNATGDGATFEFHFFQGKPSSGGTNHDNITAFTS